MLKDDRFARISGPIVLFLVIFLPGYIFQSGETASQSLSDPISLMMNMVVGAPHILLLLYIMLSQRPSSLEQYGLKKLRALDILWILGILAGILLISGPVALVDSALSGRSWGFAGSIRLNTDQVSTVLLLALLCVITGYREELFFRSYLYAELVEVGWRSHTAIAASALLFSIGHLYEGIASFLGTAAIGVFLGWCFLRLRNIHLLAIAHAIYNFLVIMITSLTG